MPTRIAVLRANALGDLMFALPALSALADQWPAAEITLLGQRWHAEFLKGRPGPVHRVEPLPPVAGLNAPADQPESPRYRTWVAEQRDRGYGLAVQLHGGGRYSNPLVADLGAAMTIGCRAPDAIGLDRDLPYVYYQHEVVRWLEVVGLVGAVGQPYPNLTVTEVDRRNAIAVLGELHRGRFVVLHPGATDPRRRWPTNRFAAVADAMAQRGMTVLVTGSADEAHLVDQVCREASAPVVDLAGRLDLNAMVGVLAMARLVISNDTGPLHVADAVGTPTVGVYWCGNLVNAGPLRRKRHRPLLSWVVNCPECGANCTRDMYPARTGGTACAHRPSFVCDVPVTEVIDAADDLLGAPVATCATPR